MMPNFVHETLLWGFLLPGVFVGFVSATGAFGMQNFYCKGCSMAVPLGFPLFFR